MLLVTSLKSAGPFSLTKQGRGRLTISVYLQAAGTLVYVIRVCVGCFYFVTYSSLYSAAIYQTFCNTTVCDLTYDSQIQTEPLLQFPVSTP